MAGVVWVTGDFRTELETKGPSLPRLLNSKVFQLSSVIRMCGVKTGDYS